MNGFLPVTTARSNHFDIILGFCYTLRSFGNDHLQHSRFNGLNEDSEIQARDFHKKQIASVVMNFSSIPWTISFHIGFICDKNTQVFEKKKQTRMHSSRIRTARSSSRPGGVSTRHPPRTRPREPGTPPDQTPLGPGTPPPVNRIRDTCKDITFPQLRLRAVKKNDGILVQILKRKIHIVLHSDSSFECFDFCQ